MTTDTRRWLRRFAAVALAAGAAVAVAGAQGRPVVDVTLLTERDGVIPGSEAKLALRVNLPDGVHVQSDTPRDPLLIATRLSVEPPAGLTASEIAYPPSTDFVQAGQPAPLAVFEQRFVVGVKLAVAKDVAPGVYQVPVTLRYQACDAATCYAPLRYQASVALRVVPATTATKALAPELFAQIRFRR